MVLLAVDLSLVHAGVGIYSFAYTTNFLSRKRRKGGSVYCNLTVDSDQFEANVTDLNPGKHTSLVSDFVIREAYTK